MAVVVESSWYYLESGDIDLNGGNHFRIATTNGKQQLSGGCRSREVQAARSLTATAPSQRTV